MLLRLLGLQRFAGGYCSEMLGWRMTKRVKWCEVGTPEKSARKMFGWTRMLGLVDCYEMGQVEVKVELYLTSYAFESLRICFLDVLEVVLSLLCQGRRHHLLLAV